MDVNDFELLPGDGVEERTLGGASVHYYPVCSVAWLREYASASGSTSMAGFGRWRTPGTPSAETFRFRFGGWNGALIAAGLVSEEEVEP